MAPLPARPGRPEADRRVAGNLSPAVGATIRPHGRLSQAVAKGRVTMSEPKISPCLWFDHRIEEAVDFYISVFGGKITDRTFYPQGGPQPAGTPLTVSFTVADQSITALNGGPHFKFTEAVSLFVRCEDQAEVDRYWELLTADGTGSAMRLAQGQIRPVLADRAQGGNSLVA